MSKLLEQAITEVWKLPEKRQEEAAEVLLGLVVQNPDSIQLSARQVEDLRRRLIDPSDLRANETEVAATFALKPSSVLSGDCHDEAADLDANSGQPSITASSVTRCV